VLLLLHLWLYYLPKQSHLPVQFYTYLLTTPYVISSGHTSRTSRDQLTVWALWMTHRHFERNITPQNSWNLLLSKTCYILPYFNSWQVYFTYCWHNHEVILFFFPHVISNPMPFKANLDQFLPLSSALLPLKAPLPLLVYHRSSLNWSLWIYFHLPMCNQSIQPPGRRI
jgi:hypothetical protein